MAPDKIIKPLVVEPAKAGSEGPVPELGLDPARSRPGPMCMLSIVKQWKALSHTGSKSSATGSGPGLGPEILRFCHL